MAQRVARARAGMDLKLSVLSALNKLADRDTQQIAMDELLRIADNLQPEAIGVYLGCLYDISPDQKSVVRREGIKLLSILASMYEELLTPHLQKIVTAVVRRLRETDSNIRDACVETIGTLVAHVPPPASLVNGVGGNADSVALSGPVGVFTKPLFDALNEQARNVQIGAAMCLSRAMDNAHDLPPACIQRLCLKLLKFVSGPNFNAKAALLPAFGGLSRAAGVGIYQHLGLIIPCLKEALQSSDWATRKAAADTFSAVALSVGGPPLTSFKVSTMALLEQYRFDKVKPARDSVVDAIHIWKNVPDPPADSSPTRAISSKSSNSNGSVISRKFLASADSRSSSPAVTPVADRLAASNGHSAHAPQDKGSVKKKTSSVPERKTNLDFFRKLSIRNSDDWHVEVAVPRSSPPASHNKENRDETLVQQAVGSAKAPAANGGILHSPGSNDDREVVSRRLEVPEVVSRRSEVLGDKLESSEKNVAKELPRRSKEANPVVHWPAAMTIQQQQQLQQQQQQQPQTPQQHLQRHSEDAGESSPVVTTNSGRSSSGAELAAIARQLSQLERGQSTLMEMLQEFMGNSQESTLSLEARVQRLERAVEDMARITAASFSHHGRNYFGSDPGYSSEYDVPAIPRRPSAPEAYGSNKEEHWNDALLRSIRTNRHHQQQHHKDEFMDNSTEAPRRPWEHSRQHGRLGEGPSARSVWQASKDEATLAAIRVAGGAEAAAAAGPFEALEQQLKRPSSANLDQYKEHGNGAGIWNIWSRVLENLQAGDLDAAYEEAICTGDELLMVRLMNRTGPVLGQLSPGTAADLVHAIAHLLQQPSLVDCALPWLRQVCDMVKNSGSKCLPGLSVEAKRALVSSLHEASALDLSERWMSSTLGKMASQLGTAWLLQ